MARKHRGVGLATTLSLTALAVLFAFVCVAACFGHLTLATRSQRLADAELAADSAAHMAGARLLANPAFGSEGSAEQRSLEVNLPQGSARLTFDEDRARLWGIPLSRNNLLQETALQGYERTIPPQSVQVLVRGESGGRHRLIEVIYNQPPFKWAVASTGNVHSSGGLQVFGVKDFGMLVNGIENLPPSQILPGHVASDSSDTAALDLDSSASSPSLITGDAQAVGSVGLGPSTVVNGQVKQHADSAKLPEITVETYDPAGVEGLQQISQSHFGSSFEVSGIARRSGDLRVGSGGLALDQGYLYVDGNLEVFGGLRGKGAIFATGNVVVHGLSDFATDNLQAIVAKGDLVLDGSGPESSSFQGLLMGGRALSARRLSLVGSLLGTSRQPGGSNVNLDQVNLVSNPQAIHLDFPNLLTRRQEPVRLSQDLGQAPLSVQAVLDPNLNVARFYDPVRDRLDPGLVTPEGLGLHYLFSDGYLAATEAQVRGHGFTDQRGMFTFNMAQPAQHLVDDYLVGLELADKVYQQARRQGLARGSFSLDPNQFIQSSDKMRRLLWRVVE